MKKTGQVANKAKMNAAQANKKNTPAKGPVMKAKNAQQARGKKNVSAKLLVPAKNGKRKNSEDDDDEDSDDDSNLELPKDSEENADQSGDDDDDAEEEEDSDSDDEGDDDGAAQQKVNMKFSKLLAKNAEEDDDDNEDDDEDDDEDEDEEGPEEVAIKQEDESDDDEAEPDEIAVKQENETSDDEEEQASKAVAKQSKNSQKPAKEAQPTNKDRKVFVKRLNNNTTGDQVREHFASCGKIETLAVNVHGRKAEAVIVFTDAAGSHAALKLHNTVLNDATILVHHASVDRPAMDRERSVLIMNVENLEKLEGSKLEKILSKCGEIASMSVVCERNVLAFVTFKESGSVKKALQLDGTTQNGLQMKVCQYTGKALKTKIFVRNIEKGVTEDDLRKMFETCGAIQNISIKQHENLPSTAVITFENQDSYCKSFLLHEEKLRGRAICLQPFSEHHKKAPFKKTPFKGKRPQQGNRRNGPPQKRARKQSQ